MDKKDRVFELDALRGLSVVLMLFHHLVWDFRYLLESDLFAFQEGDLFNYVLQPFFLSQFLIISGICSVLSKNNLKRALRLLGAALVISGFTALTSFILFKIDIITNLHRDGFFVFFNVIHLLCVGTGIAGLILKLENRKRRSATPSSNPVYSMRVTDCIFIVGILIVLSAPLVEFLSYKVDTFLFLPFGILPQNIFAMGDYLPMIPWLGVFLIGFVIGRLMYPQRKTIFPNAPEFLRKIVRPFEFVGRHSIWFYLIHWPLFKIIVLGGRFLNFW